MTEQQQRKQHIRAFMQAHYTDERLAQLLAHAQDGKLFYNSCCCFIGVATAQDRLQTHGFRHEENHSFHFLRAQELPGSKEAEAAFFDLVLPSVLRNYGGDYNELRRRLLIPMIRAEMKRRSALAAPAEDSTEVQRVAEPCS